MALHQVAPEMSPQSWGPQLLSAAPFLSRRTPAQVLQAHWSPSAPFCLVLPSTQCLVPIYTAELMGPFPSPGWFDPVSLPTHHPQLQPPPQLVTLPPAALHLSTSAAPRELPRDPPTGPPCAPCSPPQSFISAPSAGSPRPLRLSPLPSPKTPTHHQGCISSCSPHLRPSNSNL